MEQEYPASVQDVWKALTDRESLKQWYFDFDENFDLEPNHVFEWRAGTKGGEQWLHRGVFKEVIPLRKLSHSWEYPGYAGYSVVHWILEPTQHGTTTLLFRHEFPTPFDPDVEALQRHHFVNGWTLILNNSLRDYLSK